LGSAKADQLPAGEVLVAAIDGASMVWVRMALKNACADG
jgi:hypothetical protein